MDLNLMPYIVIMFLTAIVCFLIGYYSWRHRDVPVNATIIFVMMLAITEWLVASAFGYITTDPTNKIIWAKIEYIGVVSVPLLVFIFSGDYSGLRHKLTARNLILLALVPAITLLLTWTNEIHGLIWSSYIPYQENGLMFSDKTYGLWFWGYWIYSYLLLLAATVLIIRNAITSNRLFRGQMVVLILGILAPWVGNVIYVLHINPLGNYDLTPLSFAFTGIMLSLGIIRWRLFDIKPIAHLAVMEKLSDGIILLNNSNLIIDINPAAIHIFGARIQESIGKHGSYILPIELFSDELLDNNGRIRTEIKLLTSEMERHYELIATPFYEKHGDLLGRIIIIHDTTEIKLMHEKLIAAQRGLYEQKIDESKEKYRALFDNANDAIIIVDTKTELIVDLNKEAEVLLGYTKNEIINTPRINIHPPDKADYYGEHFKKHIKAGKIIDSDAEIIRKDGTIVPVDISACIVKLQDKSVMQGIFRDITESKRTANSMVLNSQRMQSLLQLNQMTEATLQEITDFALEEAVRLTQSKIGYLAFLNEDESILTMHSWSKSAMAECAINDKPFLYSVVSTGLWGEAVRQRQPIITNDYTIENTFKKGTPKGHVALKRHMNVPVFDGSKIVIVAGVGNKENEYDQGDVQQLILLMGSMWKLLERKQAETILRENEEKFRSAFMTGMDAFYLATLEDGLILEINDNFEDVFGYTREEVIGKTSIQLELYNNPPTVPK
jgi:PAS domain S-box-containing protein